MLNRQGHIPTFLLVVAALVLSVAAWMSFLAFEGSLQNADGAIVSVVQNVSYTRVYIHDISYWLLKGAYADARAQGAISLESVSRAFDARARLVDADVGISSTFFAQLRTNQYSISLVNETYLLQVPNVSVFARSSVSVNEITSTHDVAVSYTPSAEDL